MQKTLWVIICILIAGYIGAVIIFGLTCQRSDTDGTDDAQTTIDQLRQSNTILDDKNRELAASIDRLEKQLADRNQQFKMLIADLTSGAGEAQSFIRDALETIRRLEKLSAKIEN